MASIAAALPNDGAASSVSITNVRVFTGYRLSEPQTVVITGPTIAAIGASVAPVGSTIDGTGSTLLPGLIESHAHPHSRADLEAYTAIGATTVANLGGPRATADAVFALREEAKRPDSGLPTVLTADIPATIPESTHGRMLQLPASEMPTDVAAAAAFVGRRLERGADYIKAVADVPGLDQRTLNALVSHARQNDVASMVHAARHQPYQMALAARASMVHHVPLDMALQPQDLESRLGDVVAVPTLVMMRAFSIAHAQRLPDAWQSAKQSVAVLRDAGVPILAGSDANHAVVPGLPTIGFGSALLDELDCLAEAGLSNLEILRAATVSPAKYFGLSDRGIVAVGKRADLVLVTGDPLDDIRAVRNVGKVWIAGIECKPGEKPVNGSGASETK